MCRRPLCRRLSLPESLQQKRGCEAEHKSRDTFLMLWLLSERWCANNLTGCEQSGSFLKCGVKLCEMASRVSVSFVMAEHEHIFKIQDSRFKSFYYHWTFTCQSMKLSLQLHLFYGRAKQNVYRATWDHPCLVRRCVMRLPVPIDWWTQAAACHRAMLQHLTPCTPCYWRPAWARALTYSSVAL